MLPVELLIVHIAPVIETLLMKYILKLVYLNVLKYGLLLNMQFDLR